MRLRKTIAVMLIVLMITSSISFGVTSYGADTDETIFIADLTGTYYTLAGAPQALTNIPELPGKLNDGNGDIVLDYSGELHYSYFDEVLGETTMFSYITDIPELVVLGKASFIFDRRGSLYYSKNGTVYEFMDGINDLNIVDLGLAREILDIAFNNSCTSMYILYRENGETFLWVQHFDFNMLPTDEDLYSNYNDYSKLVFAGGYLHLIDQSKPMLEVSLRTERLNETSWYQIPSTEALINPMFASIGMQDIEFVNADGEPIRMLELRIGEGHDSDPRTELLFVNADNVPVQATLMPDNPEIANVNAFFQVIPRSRGTTAIRGRVETAVDELLVRVWEVRTPSFTFLESISEEVEGQITVTIGDDVEYWSGDLQLGKAETIKKLPLGEELEKLDVDLRIFNGTSYVSQSDTLSLSPGTYQAALVAQPKPWLELNAPQKDFTLIVEGEQETTVDLGPDVNLDSGFLAWNTRATLAPIVDPEAPIESYQWEVIDNGAFSFNQENMTITSLAEGEGTIALTVDGTTDMINVTITELVPDYIVNDLFLEQNGYVQGTRGISLMDSENVIEVKSSDGTYVRLHEFVYNTSQIGPQTIHFRIRSGDAFVEGTSDEYYYVDQNVQVVNSNLDDVIVLSEDLFMNASIIFYNFVENHFVFVNDLYSSSEMIFNDIRDVAIGPMDEIFMILNTDLYSMNQQTMALTLWDTSILYDAQSLTGFEGLDFDINGTIYLTTGTTVVTATLNYDTKSIENHIFHEVNPTYTINDITVNRLGDEAYIVGNLNTTQDVNVVKSIIDLSDWSESNPSSWVQSSSNGYTGIAYTDNYNYIINDVWNAPIIDRYYHDLLSMSSFPYSRPLYLKSVSGAGSRYPTRITAADVDLEIGYQKTQAEGVKPILLAVDPYFREDYPATYTIKSGSGFTVSDSGVVTGTGSGSGEIEISLDGATTTINVNVRNFPSPPAPAPTIRVSLTPDPIELDAGPGAEITSLEASASVTGTTNDTVTWSIADTRIATVDENGLVTAVAEGETTLTARAINGSTDTVDVIVFFVDAEVNPLGLVEFYEPYISGYPNLTFKPKNIVTRAELATMMSRILGLDLSVKGTPYTDIKDHWAESYILAATKAGIFSGYLDDTFKPEQEISRAEIAATISNYWDYFNVEVDGSPRVISDLPSDHWAKGYIYKLYNSGVVAGYEDGTYHPDAGTLREQVVSILNTLIDRDPLITELPTFSDVLDGSPQKNNIEAASSKAAIKNK